MAADPIIYCLERLTDYAEFERLCHDLMAKDHPHIEPLGGFSDKGRDAIEVSRTDPAQVTMFAYSVREDWRRKVGEDCAKIKKHKHKCRSVAFLSTADFTASERDEAVAFVKKKFRWELDLFGLDRLRLLLIKAPQVMADHPAIFTPALLSRAQPRTADQILESGEWRRPEQRNPATLLNARYEVVPFHTQARKRELALLRKWCADKAQTSVRLFSGPGGAGKTRLLIEWTKRLRKKGWTAGFLPDSLSEGDREAVLARALPTLIVVDYAESRANLQDFLHAAAVACETQGAPVRIALLSREEGDWWAGLLQRDAHVGHLLQQGEVIHLSEVPVAGHLRCRLFEAAFRAFARPKRKVALPARPDLEDARFGRLLYLHMASLAAVEGLDLGADTLLDEIVVHEQHFWCRRYAHEHAADDLDRDAFAKSAARTVAALTLLGGASSPEEARALKESVEGPREKHFMPILRGLYPGRATDPRAAYLASLEPDLLGEALVRKVLTDTETPTDYVERVFRSARGRALSNAFVVLARAWLHDDSQARRWLALAVGNDVDGRAMAAFEAAMTIGHETSASPLGLVLARALGSAGTALLAHALEAELAKWATAPVSVREVSVWANQELLRQLPRRSNKCNVRQERARLLNNLCADLSAVGRREEALAAADEATGLYRQLAASRPDAFLPYLAASLNNLGNRLSELNRREEALAAAEEATGLYRQLASSRPDAFLPDLAGSLNNLGTMLSGLGRCEEALAAAEEATGLCRQLAASRPDAFLPDLAMSLNNLGLRLGALGRREEALAAAEEAALIHRRLASLRPDAFLPDLASSLGARGSVLAGMERHADSAGSFHEGMQILRPFFERLPAAFARLVEALRDGYVEASKAAGEEPDRELLEAVAAVFQKLQGK